MNSYKQSRCNSCLSSLQGMLKREQSSYDRKRKLPTSSTTSSCSDDYTTVRRSLVEVYEDIFAQCLLQNRDTVFVAVSYLDRFMASKQSQYVSIQLAAMSCFYLAVKLYEPTVLPPALVCELFQRTLYCDEEEDEDVDDDASTGTVATVENIESMEMQILMALQWNMNPPTSMMFVRHLLNCLPSNGALTQWKQAALQLAQVSLDVALKSDDFMTVNASTQAVAALFATAEALPASHRAPVLKFVLQAVHMTGAEQQREVLAVTKSLKQIVLDTASPVTTPEQSAVCHKRSSVVVEDEEEEEERPSKKQRMGAFAASPRSTMMVPQTIMA